MTYEALLEYADTQNLIVREKYIPGYAGRIYDNRIAIHKDIKTQSEKACVLAEELGHYHHKLWGCFRSIGYTKS